MPRDLEAKIKFSVENGQLVVNSIDGIEQKIAGATKQTNLLKEAWKQFGGLLTTVAVLKFFKDSVKAAEDQAASLRILKTAVESMGGSWNQAEGDITKFAAAMQRTTRFGNDDTIKVVSELTRVLGSYRNAINVTKVAMDVAVGSGFDFNDVSYNMSLALSGNARGLMFLQKNFKGLIGDETDALAIVNKLAQRFLDASVNEDNLTSSTEKLKNEFSDLKVTVGTELAPGLKFLMDDVLTPLLGLILKVGAGLGIAIEEIGEMFTNPPWKWGEIAKSADEVLFAKFKEIDKKLTKQGKDTGENYGKGIAKGVGAGAAQAQKATEEWIRNSIAETKAGLKQILENEINVSKDRLEIQQNLAKSIGEALALAATGGEDAWKVAWANIVDAAIDAAFKMIMTQEAVAAATNVAAGPAGWINMILMTAAFESIKAGLKSSIPKTAEGGIVTGPQVRMVGEAGPEAIIPLDRAGIGMGQTTIKLYCLDPSGVKDSDLDRIVIGLYKRQQKIIKSRGM